MEDGGVKGVSPTTTMMIVIRLALPFAPFWVPLDRSFWLSPGMSDSLSPGSLFSPGLDLRCVLVKADCCQVEYCNINIIVIVVVRSIITTAVIVWDSGNTLLRSGRRISVDRRPSAEP